MNDGWVWKTWLFICGIVVGSLLTVVTMTCT
jgi:hypothetical protein